MTPPRIPFSAKIDATRRVPSIVTWNRLEGRPRSEDFERSLRAEVRDPLWMLTRQWQVGELTAMDAGTPVVVRVETETEQVTGFIDATGTDRALRPEMPLEARVELEPPHVDLRSRIQLGVSWLRALRARVGDDRYRGLFTAAYPIGDGQDSDPRAAAWRAASRGRCLDGAALFAELKAGIAAESIEHGGQRIADADRQQVADAASDFVALWERAIFRPDDFAERTWVPERLEYQFGVATKSIDGAASQLAATEYHGGQLDWYSFDLAARTGENVSTRTSRTYLPTPVSFVGMPNARWWELEDQSVDFGAVDVHVTDLAKLLLLEFGLTYGNDWSVIAVPVRAGTLCRVASLISRDVFGQDTVIPAAHSDGSTWSMFELAGLHRSSALYVPEVVASPREGAPIEQVDFMRDEMANLVWAVEMLIPDALGGAVRTAEQIHVEAPPAAEGLRYRLIGTVPESWIPFVPTRVAGSNREVQLQRGSVLGAGGVRVSPRGELLRPGVSPYFIHEEEIGRAGVRVTRRWQRARTSTGRVVVWLGRQRTVGVGEETSGLRFDEVLSR